MAKNKDNKSNEGSNGKKMNIVVMVVLLIVVVGAGTFAGTYLFMKDKNSNAEMPVKEIKVVVAEDLTVNLSGSGNRYLKTTVYISYNEENEEIAQEITDKTIEIQDKTSLFLKSKQADDFQSSNEVKLKKDLAAEINSLLDNGKIENVYFPKGLLVQ